jgi:hypothetical protein
MALRIRFQYPTGSTLGYSIERLSDGTFFDFSNTTFTPSPSTLVAALPEGTGSFIGRYKVTLSSTPAAQFTDGDYVVTVHNGAAANAVVGLLGVIMHSGDDATVFPGSGSSGTDPWATTLPGSYPAGTAGAILGANLDTKVSSRSTYSGGPVAGVVAPVTVGVNGDKAGYSLATAPPTAAQVAAAVLTDTTDTGAIGSLGYLIGNAPGWYQPAPSASAVAGAVRDVSNASPASGSLGEAINKGLTLIDAVDSGLALAGTPTTIQLRSDSTLPAGIVPNGWVSLIGGTGTGQSARITGFDATTKIATIENAWLIVPDTTTRYCVAWSSEYRAKLTPDGLDAIQVETGVNARQALSPILAASAGVVFGAGTGTVVIKGGNVALTRITASTDNAGNRTAVTLTLPA